MKKCNICGYAETDDAQFCSNCGHNEFTTVDKASAQARTASSTYAAGTYEARQPQAYYQSEYKRPIGWLICHIFFPFISGYKLIRPDVASGFRTFGIVWSIISVVAYCFNAYMFYMGYDSISAIVSIVCGILTLIPLIMYATSSKKYKEELERKAQERLTDELLNQPLETYADQEVKKIAERYEKS